MIPAAGDLTRDCLVFLKDRQVSSFGCFAFDFWVLRFQDLGALFSSFGCSVFEIWVLRPSVFVFQIWVLRPSVFVFEYFVFETTIIKLAMSSKFSGYENVWRHSWDSLCIVRFRCTQNGKHSKNE